MRTIAGQHDPRGREGQAPGGRDARPTHGRDAHATGMTLVELMVSLAILSIMILMASTLLVSARRTMRTAEDGVEINGDLRAISDSFRRDVARVSKDGFLFIMVPQSLSAGPYLVFTEAARAHSMTSNADANAALVCYQFMKGGGNWAIVRVSRLLLDRSSSAVANAYPIAGAPADLALQQNQMDYLPLTLAMFRYYRGIPAVTNGVPPVSPRTMITNWLMPNPSRKWVCGQCGWVYDPTVGSPGTSFNNNVSITPAVPWADESGVDESTLTPAQLDQPPYENVLTSPKYKNWACPICGAAKTKFSLLTDYRQADEGMFEVKLRKANGAGYDDPAKISGLFNLPPTPLGGINSLNDVRYNWTLMSAKLNGRPVLQWTDGSRNSDGSLRWFDQAASYYPRGHADYWQVDPIDPLHKVGRTAVDQDRRPEVNMPEFGPYGDYMALWTFAKSDNWPKALRLCLTAGDNPPKSLEIIVPLPD